jgi:tRNA-Thr(GGU) m(6)t(6)A37 methyltransferase TsaA
VAEIVMEPIGVVRTPFFEKKDAPRQPAAARGVRGRVELVVSTEMRDAVGDLEAWTHLWIVYVFHQRGEGWRPKVQPPRSDRRRGVLSTRSPHRPNPIGLSVVRLERVKECTLHILDVDMLDGSPVLDVKPYVPYADAVADASDGWLREDPTPAWAVVWTDEASSAAEWLAARGVALSDAANAVLSLGPAPHAYRRIRRDGDTFVLAVKEWRVRFTADEAARVVRVLGVDSGFKPSERARHPLHAVRSRADSR